MYLLDTNVLSALRRREKVPPQVGAWSDSIEADSTFISVITVLELEMGIMLKDRHDPAQAAILRSWFEKGILEHYQDRILDVDMAVARRCAALHVPDKRAERDALIAATALVHGMSVITRNVDDFEATGVPLVNPWLFSPN